MEEAERIHIFGIRHHGPGSSRSLRAALESLRPDIILVEGPPEANDLLPLVQHEAMQPPVALLIYAAEDPGIAAHYPFAEYSPEWQAVRYALRNQVPVRMFDLPQSVQMAMFRELPPPATEQEPEEAAEGEQLEEGVQPPDVELAPEDVQMQQPDDAQAESQGSDPAKPIAIVDLGDPLRLLAEAAGYSESEQWWDHMVEQRREAGDVFTGILEAMSALREAAPPENNPFGLCREAAMRQNMRAALAEGYRRVAVVCGAWHAPALMDLSSAEQDAALLANLPRMPVQATWVPWTNARLARTSGYGAGIESPGWYSHLWNTENGIAERWLINVARLLRAEGIDITPAHVIEAVRLAEALAALRGRPLPGLPELNEAVLTVFCFGNPLPLQLIEERLTVGDALGHVPPETPMAPLQLDFDRETKRLKMQPEPYEKLLDLDLRKPFDLERSYLLHRLALLGITWGQAGAASLQGASHGRGGTFHEVWKLKWQPEFAVLLIEAGQWGSTIARAAGARVSREASQAPDLNTLTELVEDALLADLPQAVSYLLDCLQAQAAVSNDVLLLMQALPPLAGVLRYGNVRQTDSAMIAQVVNSLVTRTCIGLPGACAALNDEAAAAMFEAIFKVDEAIQRLGDDSYRQPWLRALSSLLNLPAVHGLVSGRACRILLDSGLLDSEEAARRFGLGLTTAAAPAQSAAWVEGFLRGSGQLLVHDDGLLGVIDGWLDGLPEAVFVQLLPLLRRTFATFARPERRSIGERVKRGHTVMRHSTANASDLNFDPARADAVLPLLSRLLGLNDNGAQS